jgi:hypothetical protein
VVVWTAAAYGLTAARLGWRGLQAGQRVAALGPEERLAFVVGSPRSGTTFTGVALGSQPGWVDLGEVPLLKAAVPRLWALPVEWRALEVRRILERVRSLGLVRRLRAVEQNPETAYVLGGALRAYPKATAVHVIRDGRDVVCSLLERGWLRADRAGGDDARQPYGAHARFWVEPERRDEFRAASEARRAAWAWRRYVGAASSVPERTIELHYEALVEDPRRRPDRARARRGPGAAAPGLRRGTRRVGRALAPRPDERAGRRGRGRGGSTAQRLRLHLELRDGRAVPDRRDRLRRRGRAAARAP